MQNTKLLISFGVFLTVQAHAAELTVKNDSLTDLSSGAIQSGFVAGESAAVWLTSPCDGDIRAVQVFWRSQNAGAPVSIESAITISESGTFPIPGDTLEAIIGPVMTDGVINEYRYLDENSVIPLIVPVLENEEFAVSFTFENSPSFQSPSLITDTDGCQANKNAIFATPPDLWFDSCALGVSGDFVIRAVVECPAEPTTVDLSVTQSSSMQSYTLGADLDFAITVNNAGPADANAATLIDFFPVALGQVDWMCSAQGGAACSVGAGNGNITQSINLPANGSVTFDAVGTVDLNTIGVISNTAQVVVPLDVTDINLANNMASLEIIAGTDLIFAHGFESN